MSPCSSVSRSGSSSSRPSCTSRAFPAAKPRIVADECRRWPVSRPNREQRHEVLGCGCAGRGQPGAGGYSLNHLIAAVERMNGRAGDRPHRARAGGRPPLGAAGRPTGRISHERRASRMTVARPKTIDLPPEGAELVPVYFDTELIVTPDGQSGLYPGDAGRSAGVQRPRARPARAGLGLPVARSADEDQRLCLEGNRRLAVARRLGMAVLGVRPGAVRARGGTDQADVPPSRHPPPDGPRGNRREGGPLHRADRLHGRRGGPAPQRIGADAEPGLRRAAHPAGAEAQGGPAGPRPSAR